MRLKETEKVVESGRVTFANNSIATFMDGTTAGTSLFPVAFNPFHDSNPVKASNRLKKLYFERKDRMLVVGYDKNSFMLS